MTLGVALGVALTLKDLIVSENTCEPLATSICSEVPWRNAGRREACSLCGGAREGLPGESRLESMEGLYERGGAEAEQAETPGVWGIISGSRRR